MADIILAQQSSHTSTRSFGAIGPKITSASASASWSERIFVKTPPHCPHVYCSLAATVFPVAGNSLVRRVGEAGSPSCVLPT
jgi:hypothetical protein